MPKKQPLPYADMQERDLTELFAGLSKCSTGGTCPIDFRLLECFIQDQIAGFTRPKGTAKKLSPDEYRAVQDLVVMDERWKTAYLNLFPSMRQTTKHGQTKMNKRGSD